MGDRVTVLHPGQMGAAVAAVLQDAGHPVRWAAEGRSAATRRRAEAAGLEPAATLAAALDGADVVLSVCPPAAAEGVGGAGRRTGFAGLYLDANAISPARLRAVAERVEATGARAVDGS